MYSVLKVFRSENGARARDGVVVVVVAHRGKLFSGSKNGFKFLELGTLSQKGAGESNLCKVVKYYCI